MQELVHAPRMETWVLLAFKEGPSVKYRPQIESKLRSEKKCLSCEFKLLHWNMESSDSDLGSTHQSYNDY